MSDFLNSLREAPGVAEKEKWNLASFYESFKDSLHSDGLLIDPYVPLFYKFLELIQEEGQHPVTFLPYHRRVRDPFDYYRFGNEFLKPLVDEKRSSAMGLDVVKQMEILLNKGENVVLLANHQTEADPQAISLLLEKSHPEFAEKIIFVAGERVITDPLAIPFSLGRDLLCIYSKRYIDHPPEEKVAKQLHNKRTMELMSELLREGGKCIYVAPSGGRDRPSSAGVLEVAPFDPSSIEMFYLMAKRAITPTHFYPLALATYALLPPPNTIQVELGEKRIAKRAGIHLCFGPEISMEHFPGSEIQEKLKRREARAHHIWQLVCKAYDHCS